MNKLYTVVILIAGIVISGCSSSDKNYVGRLPGTVTAPPPPPLSPPPPPVSTAEVSGIWYTRAVNNAVNCGVGEFVDAQTIMISQNDTDLTLLTSTDVTLTGTVSGDIIEWSGDLPERGGMTTHTSASMVASAGTASGNTTWTWTDGTDSCNGTMEITASQNWGVESTGANTVPGNAQVVTLTDGAAFFYGTVEDSTDIRDAFSIVVAQNATIQVELSHFDTDNNDLDLILLDENFNEVVAADGPDTFEKVEAQLEAGKTYYIDVLAFRTPHGIAPYQLSIDVN